jgi:hypothetical protein
MYRPQGLAVVAMMVFWSMLPSSAVASSITIPGGGQISFFGEPDTATYGQTFKALPGQLNQFSFWLNDWDGSKATGSVLYTSSARATSNNGGADGFERFDFLTGGLSLVAGNQYVAFLSASNFFDGSSTLASMSTAGSNAYADGSFVFLNNGNNFGLLTTTPWVNASTLDAQFFASFSDPVAADAVPEPASLVLIGTALMGTLARRRRSRRHA